MRKVFAVLMLGVPIMGAIYGLSVCEAHPALMRRQMAHMRATCRPCCNINRPMALRAAAPSAATCA